MKFDREAWEALTVDMTPLVDCIFALILFLLVVSSWVESMEQDLSIELPTQGRELKIKAPPTRPIVVNVRVQPGGKPFYHIENEHLTVGALTTNLSRAKIRNRDQAVVIRADRNVKWEHVAAVMGCCAEAGISKVSAAVEIKETQ
ncbi:MAG: biopolymer transporter ExbD [Phycisphaerae bacterium]|nr:biopolymer transporter ExbD [Phycisphaerae bacterium]